MSLSAKILAPFIALIALFSMSTAYHTHVLSEVISRVSATGDALSSVPPSLSEVSYEGRALERLVARWLNQPQALPSPPRELSAQRAVVGARLKEVTARLSALRAPLSLTPLQGKTRALLVSYVTLDVALEHITRTQAEGWREEAERLSRELKRWSRQVREVSGALMKRAQREQKQRQELEREALLSAIGFMALITLIGVGATLYLARLLAPLRQLREGVERLGEGAYEHRLEVSGGGALAQLAEALNRMAEAIRLRDAQLEAQQAERLHQARLATVGHLTAQITHELRNPLSSIGLNAELLDEELSDLKALSDRLSEEASASLTASVDSARPLLREISKEIDRLKHITEDYLRFARLPRVALAPLDLNTHCGELIDFVRAEYEEAGVTLTLDPDPQPSEAYADANHTRSALLNLLRNAREALSAQAEARVILRVRSWGDEACVIVEDNGPGLSEEAKERLFEPFFSTKPQGTGLGLAMARQLIEAQGGRVEVSATQGGGVSVALYVRGKACCDRAA